MTKIRVAIIGTGMSLTVFHKPIVDALNDKYVLYAVMSRSGNRPDALTEDIKLVSEYKDIITDENVDLVVISTPNKTHFDYCKRALEHGKHVLCEKPLTPTAKEAEELFEIAKQNNKILCVFQNRRWDSDYLTVKEVLRGGRLGPLHDFTSTYDRYKPLGIVNRDAWKEQGGEYNDAIYNLGSHIIDQALVLFGLPQEVTCKSWPQRGVEGLDDSFQMTMVYPPQPNASGPLLVNLRATILSPLDPQPRFIIKGTFGSYTKYGTDPQEGVLKVSGESRGEGYGIEQESQWGNLQLAKEEGKEILKTAEKYKSEKGDYPAIYENLYEAISNNNINQLVVTPEQAIMNIRVIEAGLQSSREKRTIVL